MQQSQIDSLKAQYGNRLIQLELDGRELVFKPLNRAQITDLKKRLQPEPWRALELSVNACKFVCVFGLEHFDELADRFPLAFAGNSEAEGVIDALMANARGGAVIRTV
jgi:hypothetical protein